MTFHLTLRSRIAFGAAAITALAMVLLAAGTWIYVYLEDLEAIDEHLRLEVSETWEDVAAGEVDADEFEEDEYEPREGLAVIGSEGVTLGRTPSFPLEVVNRALENPGFSIQDSEPFRWRVYSTTEQGVSVVAGYNLEEFDDVLHDLASIQVLLIPLVGALTAWFCWLVAGRSLAPIREATATASQIGVDDLRVRLPAARTDDEIGQFTDVLNGMLDRIEKSYLQAKRFAGDASHELSTPLTIIKAELEKLVSANQIPEPVEHGVVSAQQEVDRMHQIIEQLLLLARFDAGRASADYAPLNLSELLESLAEDIEILSEERSLQVSGKISPGLWISGDVSQLHRLFFNLFSNATKYNVLRGWISYELGSRDGFVRFSISNSGPEITQNEREHLFERFFQSDSSHATRGHGLGLSLCEEIAHAHGGKIQLAASTADGTTFQVELPQVPSG